MSLRRKVFGILLSGWYWKRKGELEQVYGTVKMSEDTGTSVAIDAGGKWLFIVFV